jgi:dihydroorotate dehydrogenase
MVYEGPHVARVIAQGLARKLSEAGLSCIAEAVGTE